MEEQREQRLGVLIDALYGLVLLASIYIVYRYLLGWMMPLVAGYAIAMLAHPLVERVSRSNPRNARLAGCLVLVAAYALLLVALAVLGVVLLEWFQALMVELPDFYRFTLLPAAQSLDSLTDRLLDIISPQLSGNALLQAAAAQLQAQLLTLIASAVSKLGALGAGVPEFFLTCVFSIICSVLISMGYRDITSFVLRQFPKRWRSALLSVKKGAGAALMAWLRQMLTLMLVTFLELCAGLWLLRVEHWLGIAFAIALFDVLPLVGTGGILLPWAISLLLQGNTALAAGLCILWAITISVHGILELKMTGTQLGLHPLAGICAAYLGLRVMGGLGMVLFPVASALAVELHRSGHITLWK